MSNWTKEEIMAYADGQLERVQFKELKEAIANDIKARDFYQSMVFSDEVIKDTMQQLSLILRINLKHQLKIIMKKKIKKKIFKIKLKVQLRQSVLNLFLFQLSLA